MGVPVLTLFGQTVAGRLVSSVLHAIDHPEWISSDREEYCRKALALVAQGPRDQVRRRQLRAETGASRLMDATAFARDFSDALLSRCGRS
jgi:predicted O-linked N-acetylglucosamine transferase (SPINDLY family)